MKVVANACLRADVDSDSVVQTAERVRDNSQGLKASRLRGSSVTVHSAQRGADHRKRIGIVRLEKRKQIFPDFASEIESLRC